MLSRRLRRQGRPRHRGQGLVEFALSFPIFIVLFMGIVEFSFLFNALLTVNFASRDAALVASEAGSDPDADCSILYKVENSISQPASKGNITQVVIYQANPQTGALYASGLTNVYTRGGVNTMTCTTMSGASVTLPYHISGAGYGYPTSSRCDIVSRSSCTSSGTTGTTDTVGVEVDYSYIPITPLKSLINVLMPSSALVKSNVMRIEPTQW